MARSSLLRNLLAAWSASDDQRFITAARAVIDDELRKGHTLLAADLERALKDPRRPGGDQTRSLRALPRGRDDRNLLALVKPRCEFEDLVLTDRLGEAFASLVVEYERRSELANHGIRPRQRMLFLGPAGTGKSATAHALAAALSMPVAAVSLAAVTSSLLGETARNIEAIMRFAELTPCVLLIDEFDALATDRAQPGDHGELRRVVATVLQTFEAMTGDSMLVATSNHADTLDSAVWRRFDEVLRFDLLGTEGIAELLARRFRRFHVHADLDRWSEILVGTSSADVERVAIDALRDAVVNASPQMVTDDNLHAAVARFDERREAVQVRP